MRADQVVPRCVRYWKRTGVPEDAIKAMEVELERHLTEAASDGATHERVTGPNLATFAEAWAREYRPPRPIEKPAKALIPAVLALAATAVASYQTWDLATETGVYMDGGTFSTLEVVPSASRWLWALILAGGLCFFAAAFLAFGRIVLPTIALIVALPVGLLAADTYAWGVSALATVSLAWIHLRSRWASQPVSSRDMPVALMEGGS